MPRVAHPGTGAGAAAALPAYQPPACPLSDSGRRALGELASRRGTGPYETQLKEAVRFLGLSVGDLHERLRGQRERLEALGVRRRERGADDKTPEEARLETHLVGFADHVDQLTRHSEAALRHVIDQRAALEDEGVVLGDLYTAAATRSSHAAAAAAAAAAADDDEPRDHRADHKGHVVVVGTLDAFRARRAEKLAEYNQLAPHQRYALNNDYAGFKKLWHDGAAGDDGPPLSDASKWFRPNGQPVMDRPSAEHRPSNQGADDGDDDDDDDDDGDDDVAVAREVLSLKCPLTLRPMDEPYTNQTCKHTFEKAAILDYLSQPGQVQCPQTGCSQTISRARFDHDFHLDLAMVRRIQRAQQAQLDEEADDDSDDDNNASVLVRGQRRAGGRAHKEERE